jgi:hypothetical protein
MPQRSLSRVVFLSIRLICFIGLLIFSYYEYRRKGYIAVAASLSMCFVGICISYANAQGRKLAEQNMRNHGLEPGSGRSDDLA